MSGPMEIGPTKLCPKGGRLVWSHYPASGENAVMLMAPSGERLLVLSVCPHPPTPPAADDEMWIKDWSENEGVADALVKAGVVTLTGRTAPAGHAVMLHAKLTPEALADRAARQPRDDRAQQLRTRPL